MNDVVVPESPQGLEPPAAAVSRRERPREKLRSRGAAVLSDAVPPSAYKMLIEGKGRFGFTRGSAAVTLAEDGAGTAMQYQADLQIGGKIAAVGQRLLDTVSRMMLRQGLEAMTKDLERRLAAGEGAA